MPERNTPFSRDALMAHEPHTAVFSDWSSVDRIETPRLILRRPVYSDAPGLHALLSDLGTCRYSPFPLFSTIAETHFAIAEWREARAKGLRTYVGASHSDPRTPIGFIQIGSDEELGGLLSPDRSGQGLATEALRAIVATLGLQNAWTVIDAEHHALIHALEKVDIRKERTLSLHRVHPQISPEKRDCVLLRQQKTAQGGR